jgi:glycosyltransferase involved in cell wall biosynthesis
MSRGDRVICVSGAIKEYIQTHYHTPDKKITIIPRGIDLDRFNPSKLDQAFVDEFKSKYDLDGKFVVSVVGRITQLKDIETFIKAISLLKVARDDVVGLVVGGVQKGKEDYFDTLKALVRELEVEKHIIFTGSQDRIEQIYALSDVVVSSSKKPESFGRSVAEAIAMNTPVVATNHGGVLDIIQDDVNGYFYNVGDEEELLQVILKAKELEFDGYEYVSENFTLKQMVDKTLDVYTFIN